MFSGSATMAPQIEPCPAQSSMSKGKHNGSREVCKECWTPQHFLTGEMQSTDMTTKAILGYQRAILMDLPGKESGCGAKGEGSLKKEAQISSLSKWVNNGALY